MATEPWLPVAISALPEVANAPKHRCCNPRNRGHCSTTLPHCTAGPARGGRRGRGACNWDVYPAHSPSMFLTQENIHFVPSHHADSCGRLAAEPRRRCRRRRCIRRRRWLQHLQAHGSHELQHLVHAAAHGAALHHHLVRQAFVGEGGGVLALPAARQPGAGKTATRAGFMQPWAARAHHRHWRCHSERSTGAQPGRRTADRQQPTTQPATHTVPHRSPPPPVQPVFDGLPLVDLPVCRGSQARK